VPSSNPIERLPITILLCSSARITGGARGGPAPLVPGRAPLDTTTKWG